MKKKFVNVALLAALACGAPAMLTSCNDDDWKNPVNTLETSTADLKATLTEIDNQIDQLDKAIADNKTAAAAANKAAEDAMAAAKAANDEAVAASKAAEAAKKYAEQAAAEAQQKAAEELKKSYEEVKALIQANADAIALNKAAIDGNAEAIKANTGKIEGNTQSIKDILAKFASYATSEDVDAKYAELVKKLEAAGVEISGDVTELSTTVAGLNTAIEVLKGQSQALGNGILGLQESVKKDMGTLSETLAAQIVAGDKVLQDNIDEANKQIKALTDQINTLNLATNITEFAKFQKQTETQLKALQDFKTDIQKQVTDLDGKIDGIKDTLDKKIAEIGNAETGLTATNTLATANATAIASLIGDKGVLGKDGANFTALQEAHDLLEGAVDDLTTRVDDLVERINALEPLLNTMVFGQLRGLVFIPEVFVGGIESALSYSMYFQPLTKVGTEATRVFNLPEGKFTVADAKTWTVAVAQGAKDVQTTPPTVVSYHMNPTSAAVAYKDLSIVSNDAEILSRASKAKIKLDPTYNESNGFKVADGVLSVAITGEAPIFDSKSNKMPVFALQAEVAGTEDENGKPVINTVTSDYAMFAQMNIRPERIQYNMDTYTSDKYYGVGLRNFTEVRKSEKIDEVFKNSTSTTVKWNGSVDLLPIIEVAYNDIQRNEESVWTSEKDWGKFGLDLKFQLVDYTIGDNKVSESAWASINDYVEEVDGEKVRRVMLTPHNFNSTTASRDALGHMPLVYITLKQGNTLVLDGFIRVKIVPEDPYYTTDVVAFPNVDFTCEGSSVGQKEGIDVFGLMKSKTGMSQEVLLSVYKPVLYPVTDRDHVGAMRQFKKDGDIFVEEDNALGMIFVQSMASQAPDTEIGATEPTTPIVEYNFTWALETLDEQNIYQKANHAATVYVCYESGNESYPDIFIPMSIAINQKAVYTIGDKLEARWFRDLSTALLNVKVPTNNTQVTTFNTVLDQLWQNAKPKFTYVSGMPKPQNNVLPADTKYLYYFPVANNKVTIDVKNDEGTVVKTVKLKVVNKVNPTLNGATKVSNADMGDNALIVSDLTPEDVSEYNNTVLKVVDGTKEYDLAEIDRTTGAIKLAENDDAYALLNAFPSMSPAGKPAEDRTLAQLNVIVAVVPYSTCDIAYELTNPNFEATFLRPINVNPNEGYTFTDGEANGDPVKIYGMMTYSDWRGQNFKGNEWLFGYYNVKSVVPDLSRMTTNAGTVNTNPGKFVVDASVTEAFDYTRPNDVVYNTANITPNGSNTIKNKLTTEFGSITYNNTKLNVKKFKVRIPFTITYELGSFEKWVECTIDATIQ